MLMHRFFAVNRCWYRCDTDTLQERTWRSVTDRSKAPGAATSTNNSSGSADWLQHGGGCLWSVVDSQTQQLSIKFNIQNSNISSQFFKSIRPTHCLVTYYIQCASNADTESLVFEINQCQVVLNKQHHICFLWRQPIASVCEHLWGRAKQAFAGNGRRRSTQVVWQHARRWDMTRWHAFALRICNWSTTQRAGRRGAFDVYSCHTCSLYGGTWIEMPASFVVTFCRRGDADHVFQSPSQITVDRYRSGRIGIGGDTQTNISYSPML